MARLRVLIGIEQPVKVNDEIPHLGIVHRLLRLCSPGRVSARVIREQADDFHLRKILERVVLEILQLTTKDEVQQLLRGTIWHGLFPKAVPVAQVFRETSGHVYGKGQLRNCSTILA